MLKLINSILKLPFFIVIYFWRKCISPFFGNNCRFYPSCSAYGLEAYKKYNVFYATYLTAKRILKCNPLFGGGFDPVPEKKNAKKRSKVKK